MRQKKKVHKRVHTTSTHYSKQPAWFYVNFSNIVQNLLIIRMFFASFQRILPEFGPKI